MSADSPSFLRRMLGTKLISVERATPDELLLRCGRLRTLFHRTSGRVLQNDKLVGAMGAVQRIELHQPSNQDGPSNWFVTVHLSGARQIEVGQTSDAVDASTVGAHIATITGCPVVFEP